MRPQEPKVGPYKKWECSALFEGVIMATFYLADTYRLPPTVFNETITMMRELMATLEHEHVLAREKDECFMCGIPMSAETSKEWLN